MNLHGEALAMVEQPNVQPMQFVALNANTEPISQSIRSLPRQMSCPYVKSIVFLHPAPKNEALRASTPRSTQVSIGLPYDYARNNKSRYGLKSGHAGGIP
jgi:hypothetical protein